MTYLYFGKFQVWQIEYTHTYTDGLLRSYVGKLSLIAKQPNPNPHQLFLL